MLLRPAIPGFSLTDTEKGRFAWPSAEAGARAVLRAEELTMLLNGIDLAIDRGEVVPHEQVKQMVRQWRGM